MSNTSPETTDVLRASTFGEYVGQDVLKSRLSIHIQAAVAGQRMLDHILLAGAPGFGKSSLARIVAAELGDPFAELTMPVKPVPFAAFLRRWEGGVLLLDEIHRASTSQQEDLLGLLQEGYMQTTSGRRITAPPMTVIAATTEPRGVIAPLRDRFPIRPTFVDYTDEEMGFIVSTMAEKLDLILEPEYSLALGQATGGTPRNARRLVFAVRDLFTDNMPTVAEVLDLCGVESDGLTEEHIAYLRHLSDLGGHAGLQLLSSMLGLHPSAVGELERLLVKRDLVMYGSSGRELSEVGFRRISRRGLHTTGPSRLRVAQA